MRTQGLNVKDHVVLLYKGRFTEIPLISHVARICAHLEIETTVICGACDQKTREALSAERINVVTQREEDRSRTGAFSVRLSNLLRFRRFVTKELKRIPGRPVIWVGSADTALALYKLPEVRRFILHVHELYDQHPMYRRVLRQLAREASLVVCPDSARASIMQVWFNLASRPVVLPNSVYRHPRRMMDGAHQPLAASVNTLVAGKRILLYQGHIGANRGLVPFARAAATVADEWAFVVMGPAHDDALEKLRLVCPSLIHIPYVVPPKHLEITSIASVGVINYTPTSLNNIFCAPNKVWEYAGFGIPFLAARRPTIESLLANFRCGECVDDDGADIAEALRSIERNYGRYSTEAHRLFDSVDLNEIVKGILRKFGVN